MRKLGLISSILLTVSALPAVAADLPVKARPMPAVAAAYNWTGCYIGGNVGGKWVRTNGSAAVGPTGTGVGLGAPGTVFFADADTSTLIAGGQVGCNWQAPGSNWVLGIEGDFDWQRWSRLNTIGAVFPFPFFTGDTFEWRSRWQASARGRIGYAWDRFMLYATGGAAFTDLTVSSNFIAVQGVGVIFPAAFGSESQTVWGPTVGGGFEWSFAPGWSAGIEGRYTWYGSHTFAGPALATVFTPSTAAPPGTFTFAATSQTVNISTFEVMGKINFKIF